MCLSDCNSALHLSARFCLCMCPGRFSHWVCFWSLYRNSSQWRKAHFDLIVADKLSLGFSHWAIIINVNNTCGRMNRFTMCVCVHLSPLTVGASIDFYTQTNPSLLAPVQRDKPQEASHNSLLQLMANHALRIWVPREGLQTQSCTQRERETQWN